ncbi:MAG: hypothetical protein JWM16_551 [Verrucomicrobiales bacterium]|nr:hypothetical protein [Verrucomicrobiales bacterium]
MNARNEIDREPSSGDARGLASRCSKVRGDSFWFVNPGWRAGNRIGADPGLPSGHPGWGLGARAMTKSEPRMTNDKGVTRDWPRPTFDLSIHNQYPNCICGKQTNRSHLRCQKGSIRERRRTWLSWATRPAHTEDNELSSTRKQGVLPKRAQGNRVRNTNVKPSQSAGQKSQRFPPTAPNPTS